MALNATLDVWLDQFWLIFSIVFWSWCLTDESVYIIWSIRIDTQDQIRIRKRLSKLKSANWNVSNSQIWFRQSRYRFHFCEHRIIIVPDRMRARDRDNWIVISLPIVIRFPYKSLQSWKTLDSLDLNLLIPKLAHFSCA